MKNLCIKIIIGLTSLLLFSHESIACNTTVTAARDSFCLMQGDTLTASGGVAYAWSGGTLSGTSVANPLIVSSPNAGPLTYTVTSTDGVGCTSSASITLQAYDVTAVSPANTSQPSCGRNDGSIQVSIQSSPRYVAMFFQEPSHTLIQSGISLVINNLLPGTYSFILDDLATNCNATVSNIVLTDNTSHPTFDSVANKPETCFGDHDGSLLAYVGNCSSCTFSWSQDAANHTDSAKGLAAGTYTLSVSSGGCTNITQTYTVTGPSSALVLDTPLRVHQDHCNHHVGSAVATVHGGTPPYTYAWSQGTPFAGNNDSVSHLYGDSIISLTVTDSHGCSATRSDTVTTTPGPSARITNQDTICASESNGVLIVQPTSNDGPFTYRWTSGSMTTVAGGLAPRAYTVTVTNAVGCDTILTQTVYAYNAYAFLNPSPALLYQGQTVSLNVTTNVPVKDVRWLPYVDGSTGSLEAYDRPQVTTQYTVTVIYGESCELHDTVLVRVFSDTTKMEVPNTFTPNGDGINDDFYLIRYPPTLTSFHFWVFDRWGAKVYETTDVNFHWDGTDIFVANKPLNTAVFAYALEYTVYNETEKRSQGGNITLVK